MKKIINKILVIASSLFLMAITASAQNGGMEKTDKITFINGTVKEGKVLAFANEKIRFTHTGETLNYEFPKKEIEKIEYASGRTEIITQKTTVEARAVTVVSKNRVAIIPIQYTGNGDESRKEEMSFHLQGIAIDYLSNSAAELKYVDAAEINARLLNAGIIDSGIRRYTPKELATLLHVEYVIMGTVLQDNGRQVTNIAGNGYKRGRLEQGGNQVNYKGRDNYAGVVINNQQIETQVSLSIYNDAGEKLYSKSRRSILTEGGAYKNAIQYLLKRTFLYKR